MPPTNSTSYAGLPSGTASASALVTMNDAAHNAELMLLAGRSWKDVQSYLVKSAEAQWLPIVSDVAPESVAATLPAKKEPLLP